MGIRGAVSNQKSFLPPLLYKKVTVPTASVLALLGTPFVLVPGITDKYIIPESFNLFVKQAGIAYNNAAVTDLRGTYSVATNRWLEVAVALLVGFTDVATTSILLVNNQRNIGNFLNNTSSNSVGDLLLTTLGGNFTAGTGDFIIWLSYRVWDRTNLAWF